jgi:hypothetical protein
MAKLDGKERIHPVPFDAHERVTRAHHTHDAESGYQSKDYEHQEYPKQVGDVVVNNAEEEARAKAAADVEEPEFDDLI